MIDYFVRQVKRLAILIPGLVLAIITAKEVYPFLDKRIPASLAVLVTYVFTAYVIIPGAIRLYRIIIQPKHIPLYSTTPDGFACDPIHIGIVATLPELRRSMKRAGWYYADKKSLSSLYKVLLAFFTGVRYKNAPFSTLYLFGRGQDIGFQKPTDDSGNPLHRHHVRFWACTYGQGSNSLFHQDVKFWHNLFPDKNTTDKSYLWVGAASLDIGVGIIRHNGQITHRIHPDADSERDLIIKDLEKADMVKVVNNLRAGKPYEIRNRVIGGKLRSDGSLKVVELK